MLQKVLQKVGERNNSYTRNRIVVSEFLNIVYYFSVFLCRVQQEVVKEGSMHFLHIIDDDKRTLDDSNHRLILKYNIQFRIG